MTRARAKAIHQEVNSLLFTYTFDTALELPPQPELPPPEAGTSAYTRFSMKLHVFSFDLPLRPFYYK
jgi:hypothetical protein